MTLYDDRIGTNASGDAPIQNQGFGVQVQGNGDRIGSNDQSNCPYGCILISGNVKANLLLDVTSTGARVFGAHIGTDLTGTAILNAATDTYGIIDKGGSNRIGDPTNATPGSSCNGGCNVIIGIPEAVLIDTGATNSRVQANIIGLNGGGDFPASGTANYNFGIVSKADGVLIGGSAAEDRNTVASASVAQVIVEGNDSVIEGNYIGTQSSGLASIPSAGYGVQAYQAVGTVIGGADPGMGNIIGGAGLAGVDIYLSSGVQVLGNYIGTSLLTESKPASGHFGVSIEEGSSSNFIGGTSDGTGNTIALNGQAGVWMDGAAPVVHANAVRRNSIYSNGTGIDLENNANDGLAPPTITGVSPLTGTACNNCAVEIFSDAGDEGEKFEGTVLSNGTGDWTFSGPVSGPNVTATATDAGLNTSAFSEPFSLKMQGDVNCDGFITEEDFDFLLDYAAGLNNGETSDCYTLGGQGIGPYAWGDLNCDGLVNALDALFLLAYRAGIFLTPMNHPCTPIGQSFSQVP